MIISDELTAMNGVVKPSDTLMVLPSAPLFNYLTHTKPAGGMCWPGNSPRFVTPIEGFPAILVHKFNPFTRDWNA